MPRLRVRRAPPGTFELFLNLTNRHIHAQLLDRQAGRVFLAVHTTEPSVRRAIADEQAAHVAGYATSNVAAAERVGQIFSERALQNGVSAVYWHSPGKYHGKIKAFIDAVRARGIQTLRPLPENIPAIPEIKN